MFFEDGVNLIVDLIVFLHLDELWELRDGQVEELFSQDVLFSASVEASVLVLAHLKEFNTFLEADMISTWTVADILLVLFLELVLEFKDLAFSDFSEVLLEVVDFEVLSISHLEQLVPACAESVNLILHFFLHLVLVHSKDSELLLDLIDSELHIHRFVLDLADDIQKVLESINASHLRLELLLISLNVLDNVTEFLGGHVDESITN